MALLSIEFQAPALAKQSGMIALVPDTPGPHPVLYLLHGLSDNHTIWLRRTSVERYVEGTGLMVVMPDGHRSFYVNDPRPGGCAYEDHIVRDIVGFVDRTFDTVADRDGRAIAGLSMGGYGAIMLALRHPEMFAAACSHSGALGFSHVPITDRPDLDALAISLPDGQYDCFSLASSLQNSGHPVALHFDCGTDDFLLPFNRAFHNHLEGLGIAHEYAEHDGAHNWAYWDNHIHDTLDFVYRSLPACHPPPGEG